MTPAETQALLTMKGIRRKDDATVPYWSGRANGQSQPPWSASRRERVIIHRVGPGKVLVQLRWGGLHSTDHFVCDVNEVRPR